MELPPENDGQFRVNCWSTQGCGCSTLAFLRNKCHVHWWPGMSVCATHSADVSRNRHARPSEPSSVVRGVSGTPCTHTAALSSWLRAQAEGSSTPSEQYLDVLRGFPHRAAPRPYLLWGLVLAHSCPPRSPPWAAPSAGCSAGGMGACCWGGAPAPGSLAPLPQPE